MDSVITTVHTGGKKDITESEISEHHISSEKVTTVDKTSVKICDESPGDKTSIIEGILTKESVCEDDRDIPTQITEADTMTSSVVTTKQTIDAKPDSTTKTIIKESSTTVTQSSKVPGDTFVTTETIVQEFKTEEAAKSDKSSVSKLSDDSESESVSVTTTAYSEDKKHITKREISEHQISSNETVETVTDTSFSRSVDTSKKDEESTIEDSIAKENIYEDQGSFTSTKTFSEDSKISTETTSESRAERVLDEEPGSATKRALKESPIEVLQSSTTKTHEDEFVKSEKASSKCSEEHIKTEVESVSVTKTTGFSEDKRNKTKRDGSEQQISFVEKDELDKISEMQIEDSITKSSVTRSFKKEEEKSSESKTSQSVTSEEVIVEKELVKSEIEGMDSSSTDYTTKIIKTSISETKQSEDFSKETSQDKTLKIVTTSKITSEPSSSEVVEEDLIRTKLDSEEESVTESSSRKRSKKGPRIVKKRVYIYHTGSETVPEEILTEDKIREAIVKAGGKHSSTSHTRIISSGISEDLDSFSGKENTIEVIESRTEQTEEKTVTESISKSETAQEELEHIEFDPFSLITKPLEESFRKRMMEQKLSEQSMEIKQMSSKEETTFSKEKRRESLEEKDTDTIQSESIDTKVATDAKKLAMESTRISRERSETQELAQSETSTTHATTSASSTERSSTQDPQRSTDSSQPEEGNTTENKSFSLDEWDKPMGLPSPPEPLDFEASVASLTKQNTTRTTKQEGDYRENKSENPANDQSNVTDMKSGREKSNKETDSLPEKECSNQADNKTTESSSDPVYIDLTYVPHFGDPHYCNVEFFRRIRSRYYVFSGTKPSKEVFNALLEAKQDWKDKEAKVTIIPTYETDTLGYWMAVNQEALIANNIDVAPSASRCTINLQDHETSCSAYRLEL